MHVVAAAPRYLDASEVPPEVIAQETQIFKELSEKESAGKNKSPEILEKIIKGTYFSEQLYCHR
jgi:translation elongation factor EF-Ts